MIVSNLFQDLLFEPTVKESMKGRQVLSLVKVQEGPPGENENDRQKPNVSYVKSDDV